MKSFWNDPAVAPVEAFCPKCECFTTDVNWRGECRECGSEVTYEDEVPVSIGKEERDYWKDPE